MFAWAGSGGKKLLKNRVAFEACQRQDGFGTRLDLFGDSDLLSIGLMLHGQCAITNNNASLVMHRHVCQDGVNNMDCARGKIL